MNDTTTTSEDDINAELKSPISLVHEMALKRDLTVTFEVISEKGPPHMKIFVTGCSVGDITVSFTRGFTHRTDMTFFFHSK